MPNELTTVALQLSIRGVVIPAPQAMYSIQYLSTTGLVLVDPAGNYTPIGGGGGSITSVASAGGTVAVTGGSGPAVNLEVNAFIPYAPSVVGMQAGGVIQQSYSAPTATPSVLTMVAGRIPFGAASGGLLTQSANLSFVSNVLTIGGAGNHRAMDFTNTGATTYTGIAWYNAGVAGQVLAVSPLATYWQGPESSIGVAAKYQFDAVGGLSGTSRVTLGAFGGLGLYLGAYTDAAITAMTGVLEITANTGLSTPIAISLSGGFSQSIVKSNSGNLGISNVGSGYISFSTGVTERVRIANDGGLALFDSTAAVSPAGAIAFRSFGGVAQVSQNGGAWAALGTGSGGNVTSGALATGKITYATGASAIATDSPLYYSTIDTSLHVPLTVTSQVEAAGDLTVTSPFGTVLITAATATRITALTSNGLLKTTSSNGTLAVATAGTDYEVPLTFGNGLTRTVNAVANDYFTGKNQATSTLYGGTLTTQSLTLQPNAANTTTGTLLANGANLTVASGIINFAGNVTQVTGDNFGSIYHRISSSIALEVNYAATKWTNVGYHSYSSTSTALTKTGGTVQDYGQVPVTLASAASAVLDAYRYRAVTCTFTGTTSITTAAGVNYFVIEAPTYTDASALTITNSATFTIKGAPVAGGSVTLTNKYAFWVQANNSRFDGDILTSTGGTTALGSSAAAWGTLWVQNIGLSGANVAMSLGTDTLSINSSSTGVFDVQHAGSYRFKSDTTGLSFFGAATAAQQNITGSRSGNAALASLLTKLATIGLITDGTTA